MGLFMLRIAVLLAAFTFALPQVIMATHSPLLMAYPGAQLLLLSEHSLDPASIEQTEHAERDEQPTN
jgi:predicted ATPase